jgi:adenylate cyclase
MSLKEVLSELNDETKAVSASSFGLEVTKAYVLPSVDDQDITFENFDEGSKRVKTVDTCVLFIDLRRSTALNLQHRPEVLSKLYSSFVRGAIKCAELYGGKVRGIAGDRVMFLYDPKDCYQNALNTAMLLNTFCRFILRRHFQNNFHGCGIGIDYGTMLATKVGTIKRGTETASGEAKSLVWLGRPANVASKLADIANKRTSRLKINVGYKNPVTNEFYWREKEVEEFFDGLELTHSTPMIARFKEWGIFSFLKTVGYESYSTILMTKAVYDGFRRANPQEQSVISGWWKPRRVNISGYAGTVYEGAVFFKFGEEIERRDKANTVLSPRL